MGVFGIELFFLLFSIFSWVAGGRLGDGDKNILFLVSFSMGHFNSLFLLLCVQIFNLLFLSLVSDVSFGFPLFQLSVSQGHFGLRKVECFCGQPELLGHELQTGGNFRVGGVLGYGWFFIFVIDFFFISLW